jgi:glycosyltransferase 2 family protein
MSRRTLWTWARLAAPAVLLAVLVWRLGTGAFLDSARTVDGAALAEATAIGALTTTCCAWRWKTVARGLGINLSLRTAVAAYYRSLFLNLTVPGGVVGDVHRAVSHGRDAGDVGRALRAVAWERFAGQLVQALVTVIVLLALPSPVRASMPLVAIGVAAALVAFALVARARPGRARSAWTRGRMAVAADIRAALLARRAWLGIVLASALVVAGHAATFLIAARTAGTTAPASQMLPIALLAMLAMVLPNVGGWGPREGATAWLFAASALGAHRGVATAVVYGVMVFVASLPGAAILILGWLRKADAHGRLEAPVCEAAHGRIEAPVPEAAHA